MTIRGATRLAYLAGLGLAAADRRAFAVAVVPVIAVVGIGHGALDHLVPQRLGIRTQGGAVAVATGYAVLAATAFRGYLAYPRTGVKLLILLGAAHFGAADVAFVDERPPSRLALGAAIAVRAVGTVVLPVVVIATPRSRRRTAKILASLAAVALACARSLARGRTADACDLALPVAALAVVPPSIAFTAYFALWHSPRHLARVLALDPAGGSTSRRVFRAVCEAAPIFAVVALATTATLRRRPRPSPRVVIDLGLAAVFALTVPHQIVVLLMDRAERRATDQRWTAQPP